MRMKKRKECSCSRGPTAFAVGLVGCVLVLGGSFVGASPAHAVDPLNDVTCPDNLNSCTANDISTTVIDSIEIGGDDCADGFLDVQWTFEFETTANERYDVAVYIARDGGTVQEDPISTAEQCAGAAPQVGDGDLNSDASDADNDLFEDNDGTTAGGLDTCGDLSTAGGPVQWTVSATVACTNVTPSGQLTIESCRVWEQNGNHAGGCTDLSSAGTGSKCDCDPIVLQVDPCSVIVCDDGDVCNGLETCDSSSGVAVCTDGTPLSCDDDLYCNGSETCDPSLGCQAGPAPNCDDGVDCTIDACNEDTDSCDNTPDDSFCSGLDDQCNDGVCDALTGCFAEPKPQSTPCEDGNACTSETGAEASPDHCDGAGSCVGIPVDCSGLDDQCSDGVCDPSDGTCFAEPKPQSTPCEDGNACTSETGAEASPDHCDGAGLCVGVPVDCSGLDDQCNDGVCDPTDGACFAEPKPQSTPCEDGNACTSETGAEASPDHCDGAGSCVGIPVDCSGLDDQCNDGACDPAFGACFADPKPLSTPCEDGNACTSETGAEASPDHCDGAGSCVGIPVDCSGLDDQCNVGVCDPAGGTCFADPVADSTPCQDGDACTSETGVAQTPDHCFGGVCTGIPVDCSALDNQCNVGTCDPADGACFADPVADSTPCEDGDFCTSETGEPQTPDHCEAGECVGVPVDCSAEDDQCNVGTCDPADGACFPDPVADSTPCEDGDVCTSETGTPQTPDHCYDGVCTGVPVDCSDFDDQCNDGECNVASGACEAIPLPDSTPCEDGSLCTSETGAAGTPDHCESGECVGIPVDCNDDRLCTDEYCDEFDPASTPSGCVFIYDETNDDLCPIEPPDCELGECDPEVCRTKGFWGTHAPLMGLLLFDDLYGFEGFEVCGQAVTSIEPSFGGSAVEGLCTSPRGDVSISAISQLLAASFNCILTSGYPDCTGTTAAEIWLQLNSACTAGNEAMMREYHELLDCWNNGGEYDQGLGCVIGLCDGIPGAFCGEVSCDRDQECIPFADSCHEQPLEILWLDPPMSLEPASQWVDGEKRCRDARRSRDDFFRARCPGHPSCSLL